MQCGFGTPPSCIRWARRRGLRRCSAGLATTEVPTTALPRSGGEDREWKAPGEAHKTPRRDDEMFSLRRSAPAWRWNKRAPARSHSSGRIDRPRLGERIVRGLPPSRNRRSDHAVLLKEISDALKAAERSKRRGITRGNPFVARVNAYERFALRLPERRGSFTLATRATRSRGLRTQPVGSSSHRRVKKIARREMRDLPMHGLSPRSVLRAPASKIVAIGTKDQMRPPRRRVRPFYSSAAPDRRAECRYCPPTGARRGKQQLARPPSGSHRAPRPGRTAGAEL